MDAGCGPGWTKPPAGGTSRAGDGLTAANACSGTPEGCRRPLSGGDIESLPLATATFDLAWSNLAVQWCGNLYHGTPRAVSGGAPKA
ncbi:methyltransferase domain-containing protein [Escherichia coli]